jgi:hypothetical protein
VILAVELGAIGIPPPNRTGAVESIRSTLVAAASTTRTRASSKRVKAGNMALISGIVNDQMCPIGQEGNGATLYNQSTQRILKAINFLGFGDDKHDIGCGF